jgi:hypothetical protein
VDCDNETERRDGVANYEETLVQLLHDSGFSVQTELAEKNERSATEEKVLGKAWTFAEIQTLTAAEYEELNEKRKVEGWTREEKYDVFVPLHD